MGMKFVVASFVGLGAAGFLPVGNWLIMPLENRFADVPLPQPSDDIAGIIILGGFEDGWVSAGRPSLAVNEAAERLTEGMLLAKRWPNAKLVYTGGVGGLLAGGTDAATPISQYLQSMGLSQERLVLDPQARNTFENAIYTRELLKPSKKDTWVLVTSAFHMPRAMGVFRKAGFNVTPACVDFRTRDYRDLYRLFGRVSDGLKRADRAVREWLGLIWYWLMGRTSNLFPGP